MGNGELGQPPEHWARLFERHLDAGDLEALLQLYEADARFVSPSGETLVGRDGLRPVLAELIRIRTRLRGHVVRVETQGEIAVLYTDWEGSSDDPAGGRIDLSSRAIEVLRRQPDRSWRLILGDPHGRAATQGIGAHAEMLIHGEIADVFDAFVDPQRIRKFWLKHASGPLALGARVEWEFMLPGARETVTVTAFSPRERIAFTWSDGKAVELRFHARAARSTRVEVDMTGFVGPDAAAQAVQATEGFTIVLCDLKTLLETGKSGGMVRDKACLLAEG